ncbi:hypothetical protein [Salmonella phage NINP13076]|nr:hypothetical protein [Salmonella phage NINP13076]
MVSYLVATATSTPIRYTPVITSSTLMICHGWKTIRIVCR